MKLAVTGLRGIPGVMGGIETHCEALYPRLCELEPELEVLVYARSNYVGDTRGLPDRIKVIALWAPSIAGLEAFVHTFLCVLHARIVARISRIHVHGIGPSIWAPLARLLGMEVIVTHHGRDYDRDRWGPVARFVLRTGEATAVRFASKVICVSPTDRDRLSTRYPDRAHEIVHIPNGAQIPGVQDQKSAVLSELGLTSKGFYLAVGRLVPEKAFDHLVAAMASCRSARKLVIVGAADHADPYSRELSATALPNVIFAGRRDRYELAALYRNAELFLLPSKHEGLPIVALEALAASCPVALSDIEANRALGLPAHHYFPVGDLAAIRALLEADDHSALRADSESYAQRFDWSTIAKRTLTHVIGRRTESSRTLRDS
jgi:glycosyltransferase involved in cell wall biosynthesis